MSKARTLLTNAGLLMIVCAVLFGVSEFVVRLFFKDAIALTPRYQTAAEYGDVTLRRIRPDMAFSHTTVDGSWRFTTNAQGFRNYVDFEREKPPGRLRVVALGDSHTQGYECDQDYTYSAVIERYLNARGIDAEVINTGVSGFSTAEALLLLEREMVEYSPDYVVLGFFANDYEDNLKAGLFELDEQENLKLVKREHIPGVAIQDVIYAIPGVQWMGENSYFYSLLFNTVWDFYKGRLAQSAREKVPTEMVVASKDRFSGYEVRLAAELIRRMHAVANAAGAELIVLDIPRAVRPNGLKPSIQQDLLATLQADHVITTEPLQPYVGAALLHVPHGGRHITEFTHTILGVETAQYIYRRSTTED